MTVAQRKAGPQLAYRRGDGTGEGITCTYARWSVVSLAWKLEELVSELVVAAEIIAIVIRRGIRIFHLDLRAEVFSAIVGFN